MKTMNNSSIWKHYAAFIYDIFPILGIVLLTSGITLLLRGGIEAPAGNPWFRSLIIFEIIIYYVYSWKVGGQTLGMRAWKIKIVSNDKNQDLSWSHSLLRFFVGVLSTLTFGFGIIWKMFSKENKSWMDLCSHSKTISYENL